MRGHRLAAAAVVAALAALVSQPALATQQLTTPAEPIVPAAVAGTSPRLSLIAPTQSGSAWGAFSSDASRLWVTAAPSTGSPAVKQAWAGITSTIFAGSMARFVMASPDDSAIVVISNGSIVDGDAGASDYDYYVVRGGTPELVTPGVDTKLGEVVATNEDASSVIFESASALDPADDDLGSTDLYRWDAPSSISLLTPGTGSGVALAAASPDLSRIFVETDLSTGDGTSTYEIVAGTLVPRVLGATPSAATADGSTLFFSTPVALVGSDTDDLGDVYRWSDAGTVLLSGGTASPVWLSAVSRDGSRMLVVTDASLIGTDTDGTQDLYLLRSGLAPLLITPGSDTPGGWRANPDVTTVVFSYSAANEQYGVKDLQRWQLSSPATIQTVLSVASPVSSLTIRKTLLSADGSRIAIQTAEALVPEDVHTTSPDAYLWDAGTWTLLTPGATSVASADHEPVAMSPDGSRIVVKAYDRLVPEDTNNGWDAYLVDLDVTPPAPTISGGSAWTNSGGVDLILGSTGGDAVRFECSVDGGPATACQSPVHIGGLAEGAHTLGVTAWDAVGNTSGVVSHAWSVDLSPPTASPVKAGIVAKTRMGTTNANVTITFTGWMDSGGSGFAGYRLERRTDGGAWVALSGLTTGATRAISLASGHTYDIAAVAVDNAGNVSPRSTPATFRVKVVSEGSSAVSFRGTWTSASSTSYMGGKAKYAKAAGAKASYSFTGRSVSWVTTVGPSRGKAEVYIDGVFRTTVNLYSSSTTTRKAMYTATWSTAGSHRITVRVLGSPSTHPRVDVDSFVVLR